jgi:hypothetical protein
VRCGRLLAIACAVIAPTHANEVADATASTKRCLGKKVTITSARAVVRGTNRPDVIVVTRRSGATVRAGAGADAICGGRGPDRLFGGGGKDGFKTDRSDKTPDLVAGERVNGRRRSLVRVRKPRTLEISPSAVSRLTDAATGSQSVLLEAGTRAPKVGTVISIPIGARAPRGLLGRATRVVRESNGVLVRTTPVALDEAYSQFSASKSGTIGELGTLSARSRTTVRASTKPRFDCKGTGAGPTIQVEADFDKVNLQAEIQTYSPSILVLLSGTPKLSLDFAFEGRWTCTAASGQSIFIPIAGPLGVTIRLAFSFDLNGALGADFTWSPRIAYGFFRSRSSGNADFKEFRSGGDVGFTGAAGGEVFLGVNLEASVAGRVGLGGTVGPVLRAMITSEGSTGCARIEAALRGQLTASAHVFFKDWTFALATLTVGTAEIFKRCAPGLGAGLPGGPAGPGGPPGGGGGPPASARLAAGNDFTCGLRSDGVIACWGRNEVGQTLSPGGTFTQIAGGYMHACALRSNATVACWGLNDSGQSSPPTGPFAQVVTGFRHSCGLRPDGTVVCWGANTNGVLEVPTATFTQIATTYSQTCGIHADRTATCWGSKICCTNGGLPPTGDRFSQIAVSWINGCGIRTDRTVVCWGANNSGMSTPPLGVFTKISAGGNNICGIREDQAAVCWGYNSSGQNQVPLGTYSEVAVGGGHTCGFLTDGHVRCWGSNDYGEAVPPF